MIKRLVVGNWKMNGLGSTFVEVSKLDDWKVRSEEDFEVDSVDINSLTSDTWIR